MYSRQESPVPNPLQTLTERRQAARYTLNPDVAGSQAVQDESGKVGTAEVLNISALGVGLLLDHWVSRGELLKLELPSKDGSGTRKLLAQAAVVDRVDQGHWRVGCTFLRPLSDFDLLALL